VGARWGTETLDFGTVAESTSKLVDRDFSSVVTLVATLSTTTELPDTERVAIGWRLSDSVDDGNTWWSVEDTDGSYRGSIGWYPSGRGYSFGTKKHQTRRFVVPFGPKIYVGLTLYNPMDESERVTGSFENVVATLFWRALDAAPTP
jgi:hypothetical protein